MSYDLGELGPNVCCICGEKTYRVENGIPVDACGGCYTTYEEDIKAHAPWFVYLSNAERARRKRRNRLHKKGKQPSFVPLSYALSVPAPDWGV